MRRRFVAQHMPFSLAHNTPSIFYVALCPSLAPSESLWLSLALSGSLFVGQVMSPDHFDQMSQRSQVSWIALQIADFNCQIGHVGDIYRVCN